jgi:hypothetical protein
VLHGLGRAEPACENAREAHRPIETEQVGELRPSKIGFDHQHAAACGRERDGEVRESGRLAFVGHGAGDDDNLARMIDFHEPQVGPQLPKRFGTRGLLVLVHGQRTLGHLGVEGDDAEVR